MPDDRLFLKQLKLGDAVVTGRIYRGKERGLRTRRVVKVTPTQVVLDNGDHFKIDTGSRIGGLGDSILRVATQADSDREESERHKREQARKAIEADKARRNELANLFSAAFRPTVFAPSSNQPGQFNLEFYNVDEKDIRKMAELLKSFGQS
jgi:hypothetical protein